MSILNEVCELRVALSMELEDLQPSKKHGLATTSYYTLYLEVCNAYNEYLEHHVVRTSNHHQNSDFTDEEALCVYLWGKMNRST